MKRISLLTSLLSLTLLVGCNQPQGSTPPIVTQPTVPPPSTPPPAINLPPVVQITVGGTIEAGKALAFDGSGSRDPEGSALVLRWDFADGMNGGTARIAHVFSSAGQYTVRLTATDAQGLSASTTQAITVTAPPAAVRTQTVAGRVLALDGSALAGVTATVTGGASATSASDGALSLPLGIGIPQTLRFTKAGLATQVLTLTVPSTSGSDARFETVMLRQEPALTLADATAGGTLTGKDGAQISLPANALVTASGAAVTGAVQISLTPVDVTEPRAGGFPGRFEGINADASSIPLVSLGPTEFVLTQNGAPVQIAPGATATITMPIYADRDLDGRVFVAGDRIPLWSLDEQSGGWINEGEGVLVAAASSPTGLAMQASVQHFTWWNPDRPFIPREPSVKMKCVYDDDIGIPESRANFQQATLCNWLAELDRGIPEQKSAVQSKAQPAPDFRRRLPGFSGSALIPTDGGAVTLNVPVDNDVLFTVTALNGRFVGAGSLRAGDGVTELVVKMRPVDAGTPPAADVITLPYDQTLTLQNANEPLALNFDGSAFRWARITVTHMPTGTEQAPDGTLRLLRGTAPLAVRSTLVDSRTLTRLLPEAARYTVQLTPSSNTPARVRVQIEQVGSDQDETLPLPFSNLSRTPAALTTLRLTLPIEAARTLYLTSKNSESQMRLTAPDGKVLLNTEVGSAQVTVSDERSLPMSATGNAVLQIAALDASGASLRLGASLSHWLPVTPLLDGFALVDLVADRNALPVVLLSRSTGTGSDTRFALSLRRFVDGGWQAIGPELADLRLMSGSTGGAQAALAFDGDNAPILLYGADTSVVTPGSNTANSQFVAQVLGAQGWQPLANDMGLVSSSRVGLFAQLKLLVDTQGRPVAGLPTNTGSVLVTVLANGQWQALGNNMSAADSFSGEYFDLAAENNGRVYVVTAPRSGNGTVVRRFTPSPAQGVWEPVGPNGGLLPQPASESGSFAPRLALDANNNPIVAGSSQRFTAVWRFDGNAWTNGSAQRISSNDFAGFIGGFALLGPRALMAYINSTNSSSRAVVQANDAADVNAGLGANGGEVVQFTPNFAFNRNGNNQRLLNAGGEVYQAIQSSNQMQLLRLTE
ncbi:MAG: PKD domain-containing protein [Stagnimonas sp.]|nr:PKD domain-containing protein [Stagnimonas sp.]